MPRPCSPPSPQAALDDQFWRNAGQTLLAAYLMAAAHRDGSIRDVLNWADRDSDRSLADTAALGVRPHRERIERDTTSRSPHRSKPPSPRTPRYKAGVTGQVLQALEPFRLPHIRRMCDVPIGDSFDPAVLLRTSGTIWMLGSESHQRQAAGSAPR